MHSSLRLDIRLLSYSIVRNPWSSLIPLSHGSFDVIVGMDWLSKRKFVIVCHEKVVRIPLEGDEILWVHGSQSLPTARHPQMMNCSEQLQKCKTKVSYVLVIFRGDDLSSEEFGSTYDTIRDVGYYLGLAAEMLRDLDQQMEKRADDGKANVVTDVLSRKERVKPIRVRAMAMTIQYGVRGMILAAQSEAFKQEMRIEIGSIGRSEMDEAMNSMVVGTSGADKKYYNLGDILRWMIYLVVLADAAESVRDTIGFDYHSSIWCAPFEALYGMKCSSPVLWAEIGESSLIGPELVQETTDKVVLIKEKLKEARDRQKSYADNRRKPLEFEVGDRVMLKVSPWKGVIQFGKKDKLAPRYVGPFEILERIGPGAYRLRLPKELSGVHDTFHVLNLKKCLADASLHVPLDEIKVDKTLCFVEEPVEIRIREVKSLKRSRISLVKVRWNLAVD
ncbi:hypothetical protein Tco_0508637 [Tanacetum coccineum]